MRVVLDANIYVSALVNTRGAPSRILAAWREGAFDLLLSAAILDEIGRVLGYPRIARRHGQDEAAIGRFLRLLAGTAIVVEPPETLAVIEKDESDNRYLECAAAGKAAYIVSGDGHLLDLGEYRGIAIVAPAVFVAILSQEGSGSGGSAGQ